MTKRVTLNLGKIDYNGSGRKNCRVTLEVELRTKKPTTAPYLDTDLMPLGDEITELSICGNVWNLRETDCYACGQIVDTIREYFKHNRAIMRLCEIWDQCHLNGMIAGTREQNEALKDFHTDDRMNYYTRQCEYLGERGLLFVDIPFDSRKNFEYMRNRETGQLPTRYKYGQSWLYQAIPADVIEEINAIIEESQPTHASTS